MPARARPRRESPRLSLELPDSRRFLHGDLGSGAVLFARKDAVLDVLDILLSALDDDLAQIRVLFHKFRYKAIEQPERVVADQNLSVAIRPRADPDGRDRQLRGDSHRQLGGN